MYSLLVLGVSDWMVKASRTVTLPKIPSPCRLPSPTIARTDSKGRLIQANVTKSSSVDPFLPYEQGRVQGRVDDHSLALTPDPISSQSFANFYVCQRSAFRQWYRIRAYFSSMGIRNIRLHVSIALSGPNWKGPNDIAAHASNSSWSLFERGNFVYSRLSCPRNSSDRPWTFTASGGSVPITRPPNQQRTLRAIACCS